MSAANKVTTFLAGVAMLGLLLVPLMAASTTQATNGNVAIVAQVPSVEPTEVVKVIEKAAQTSWEAGLLATMFIAAIGGLTWLMRSVIKQSEEREKRMALRIDKLEDSQRTDLKDLVSLNTKAYVDLTAALNGRPCFWGEEHQKAFMDDFKKSIGDLVKQGVDTVAWRESHG